MPAQKQNKLINLDCKVVSQNNQYILAGTFQGRLVVDPALNELDQIEAEIEALGQEFKRQITRHTLETADSQIANPDLHKHGSRPLTIVGRYGKVRFKRQRLFNPKKKETLIPSAVAWETSKHTHLTAGVIDAACKESQQVSYRKSSSNLSEHAPFFKRNSQLPTFRGHVFSWG